MASSDVTVMGAGIFGLSVAWACIRRGARVRIIDPNGVGAGASGGILGALAPHVPENWNPKKAFQLESLLMAQAWWQEVEEASGRSSGYGRLGRLQPLHDDRAVELARSREVTAAELWGEKAQWRVERATDAWAPATTTGLVIYDDLTARVHPRKGCQAISAALQGQGGEVVGAGEPEGAIVWATGYEGLAELSHALGKRVGAGVKGQAMLLRHDAGDVPQILADGLHIVPHRDGTVAIGSTSERTFEDPVSVDEQCDGLLQKAAAVMPLLAGAEEVARWAGVRPRAKSRAPMLGAWPGRPGHFVTNGGFKIGFGMAPMVGEVMADLVLEGLNRIPQGFTVDDNL